MEWLTNYKIILASQSPRRQELLRLAGLKFEVQAAEIDEENYPKRIDIREVPEFLAHSKAAKVFELLDSKWNTIVIAADCLVFFENRIFSKPNDRSEAKEMLQQLAGNTHEVISGLCVLTEGKSITTSVTTRVEFNPLTNDEIEYYIDHYPPYDKAGAYGIQDWIGLCAVKSIHGSYTNIMGLPMERLYRILVENFKS